MLVNLIFVESSNHLVITSQGGGVTTCKFTLYFSPTFLYLQGAMMNALDPTLWPRSVQEKITCFNCSAYETTQFSIESGSLAAALLRNLDTKRVQPHCICDGKHRADTTEPVYV